MLFKWSTNDRRTPPLSHLLGVLLLLCAIPLAFILHLSALSLSTIATTVLVFVALWESVALKK
jgi:low temperature requirement protein LtrA